MIISFHVVELLYGKPRLSSRKGKRIKMVEHFENFPVFGRLKKCSSLDILSGFNEINSSFWY